MALNFNQGGNGLLGIARMLAGMKTQNDPYQQWKNEGIPVEKDMATMTPEEVLTYERRNGTTDRDIMTRPEYLPQSPQGTMNNIHNSYYDPESMPTGKANAPTLGDVGRMLNPNVSVVDYMNQNKMDASFGNRGQLAKRFGIGNYKGTAEQNKMLIEFLRAEQAMKDANYSNPMIREDTNQIPNQNYSEARKLLGL